MSNQQVLPAETQSQAMVLHSRANAVAEREKGEIQMQVLLAKQYPRNENQIFARVLGSYERLSLAEKAFYTKPKGKAQISGPSVHLARYIGMCWGNVNSGWRVIDEDEEYISIEAYAHDLETNYRVVLEDRFRKAIPKKIYEGRTHVRTDWIEPNEEQLRELQNRRGAFLERNCLLKILPPDLVEDAQTKARVTLKKAAEGDLKKSPADTAKHIALAFDRYGVTVMQLEHYIGHELSKITQAELATLREILGSLKSEEISASEIFALSDEEIRAEKKKKADAAASGADDGKEEKPSAEPKAKPKDAGITKETKK